MYGCYRVPKATPAFALIDFLDALCFRSVSIVGLGATEPSDVTKRKMVYIPYIHLLIALKEEESDCIFAEKG